MFSVAPTHLSVKACRISRVQAFEEVQARISSLIALVCRSLTFESVHSTLTSIIPLIPLPTAACVGITEQRHAVGAMLTVGRIGSYQLEAIAKGKCSAEMADALAEATFRLAALLRHDQPTVAATAASAIGFMGSFAALPIPDGEDTPPVELSTPPPASARTAQTTDGGDDNGQSAPRSKLAVVRQLVSLLEGQKTKEKVCISQPSSSPHTFSSGVLSNQRPALTFAHF